MIGKIISHYRILEKLGEGYTDRPHTHQTVGAFTLACSLLGGNRFGAVEWR